MILNEICKITKLNFLSDSICDMSFETKEMSKTALCGQFVHIKCGEGCFLRRPISICDISQSPENKTEIRIIFDIKGKGTKWLSARKIGDEIDVLGSLGNGFNKEAFGENPVFIGGGIGAPPMLLTAKTAKQLGLNFSVILGFRDKKQVILESEFSEITNDLSITTNDGSYATKGFVTDILAEKIKTTSAVFACGPKPMLKAVANLASEAGVDCYVSMEELMGCGVGACLVCACKLKSKDKDFEMKHVCKEGPVFKASEVLF